MNIQLRHLLEAIKLVSSAMAGMAVISSIYVGIVKISGGRVIPWTTPDEIQSMLNKNATQLRVEFVGEIKSLNDYVDGEKCKDYTDRYHRAQMSLSRNPRDQTALDLLYVSGVTIATIPNCHP